MPIAKGKERKKIKEEKPERREGVGIPLRPSVLNANYRAYRRLSGLIDFSRQIEFRLYQPRPFSRVACPALAYSLARWEHCFYP